MLALILVIPLLGFVINGVWHLCHEAGGRFPAPSARASGIIGSVAIGSAFLLALALFLRLVSLPVEERVVAETLFSWIGVGSFVADFALRYDALSSVFVLVITGVGALIHVYSIGYMAHDETPAKFFAYLNLFCFAMLALVLGANLPVAFLGWEGVGLCSYLLIGYWYQDPAKASAGKKAFIANRIGDIGFLLGMFVLFSAVGSLEFSTINATAAQVPRGTVTFAALLLFLGCTGKSAQIPLYVWLPDAMAGPTPVSALIHAATMVTAGVYLVARLTPMFALAPAALTVISVVGATTALFAATIAIAQKDIKKVLAYSTISQLGYMFLACGIGASAAGVFHVVTHAFFKALLFLAAGSVIHGMHEEQNILKMGGLRSKMPRTFLVFAAGWLAICGLPPFSGFFSKDEILWRTFSSSPALWLVGFLTAVLTALYMTRLFALVFLGTSRHEKTVHESPSVMIVPLQVLAVLSVVGGLIGFPHYSLIEHWLEPVLAASKEVVPLHSKPLGLELALMAAAIAAAGVAIVGGLRLFSQPEQAEKIRVRWRRLHQWLEDKWYVDELYEAVVVRPVHWLSKALWSKVDVAGVDGAVLGVSRASEWSGRVLRLSQTGSVRWYGLLMLLGLIAIVGYLTYGLV